MKKSLNWILTCISFGVCSNPDSDRSDERAVPIQVGGTLTEAKQSPTGRRWVSYRMAFLSFHSCAVLASPTGKGWSQMPTESSSATDCCGWATLAKERDCGTVTGSLHLLAPWYNYDCICTDDGHGYSAISKLAAGWRYACAALYIHLINVRRLSGSLDNQPPVAVYMNMIMVLVRAGAEQGIEPDLPSSCGEY